MIFKKVKEFLFQNFINILSVVVVTFLASYAIYTEFKEPTPPNKPLPTTIKVVDSSAIFREKFICYVKCQEGGISSDPNDCNAFNLPTFLKGAHTNKGVSWWTFTKAIPVNLTTKLGCLEAKDRFTSMADSDWVEVWDSICFRGLKLDSLKDYKIAYTISDFCWGSGTHGIIKAQEALNLHGFKVPVDGRMGSQTIFALNSLKDSKAYLRTYCTLRRSFYFSNSYVHRNGLMKRLDDFENLIGLR